MLHNEYTKAKCLDVLHKIASIECHSRIKVKLQIEVDKNKNFTLLVVKIVLFHF